MQFQREQNTQPYSIKAYEERFVQINQLKISNSFVISPTQLINPWQVKQVTDLTLADFKVIFDLNIKLLLLGTGSRLRLPSKAVLKQLYASSIGIEMMTTPSACRTFCALSAENRSVGAAFIID